MQPVIDRGAEPGFRRFSAFAVHRRVRGAAHCCARSRSPLT